MPFWYEFLSEPVQKVVCAALEIVADFDTYGEVLQIGDNDEPGTYGADSSIERLRTALQDLAG